MARIFSTTRIVAAALLAGCSPPPEACAPGATQACACPGGDRGVQTCDATGSVFGPCGDCAPPLVGTWVANRMDGGSDTVTYDAAGTYTLVQVIPGTSLPPADCTTTATTTGTWTSTATTLTFVIATASQLRTGCSDVSLDGPQDLTGEERGYVGESTWSIDGTMLTLTEIADNGHPMTNGASETFTRRP